MKKEDYQKLNLDDKFNFLNSELASGKTFNDLQSELGFTKQDLAKAGFYLVGKKFLRKPIRGYQTPDD